MKQVCKYHPAEEASWHCSADGLLLCDSCAAVQAGQDERHAWCFLCNNQLQGVSAGVEGPWFWTILAHFVRYPLALTPLIAALIPAVLAVAVPRSALGLALIPVGGVLCGKLGYRVIGDTVRGRMSAPGPGALGDAKGWQTGVAQWVLFAVAAAGIGLAWWYLGLIAGTGLALLVWLLLPAMLLGVQEEDSPLAILDLRNALATLLALNISYWVLVPVLFAGFLALSALVSVIVDLLPSRAGWPLAVLLVVWFWFSMMHLLGYLGFQYAGPLGFNRDRNRRGQRSAERPEEDRRRDLLMKAGRFGKVVKQYQQLLEKHGKSLQYHEDYFKLLNALNDQEGLLEHASDYLNAVQMSGQSYRLPGLLSFYRELDPAFKPDTPQLCWDIAQTLAEGGRYKEAVQLLQDLHKRAPTWPGIADAYCFVARVLVEQFNLTGKANQYLRFIEQRFREQEILDQVAGVRRELGVEG
jgi:tetratricopeptide (TPR) repeat protein